MKGNVLIRNTTVHTMGSRGVLEHADILIREGRIAVVGGAEIPPEPLEILDGRALIATPGLIDVHTHMGACEEGYPEREASDNEMTDPAIPQLRILDAINPRDRAFSDARESGVTVVQVLPGSGNVIGGECAILATAGDHVEEMLLRAPSGMKVAFGENPKGVYGSKDKYPSTRMGVAACLREHLVGAQNYGLLLEHQKQEEEPVERDLGKEALLRVLSREVPLRIHAHRGDDISTALRIAEEFGCICTLEHGTEGHLLGDLLVRKKIPVAFGPFMCSKSKLELAQMEPRHLAELYRKGVPLSLMTDHPVLPIGYILAQGGRLIREGLAPQEVLELLTSSAAAHLGLSSEIGSLEEGKRGDLVLWDGDPFAYTSGVVATVIEGTVVYRKK